MHQPDVTAQILKLLSERPVVGSPADDAATRAITVLIDASLAGGVPPREALAALASRVLQVAAFDQASEHLARQVYRHLQPDPA